MEVAQTPGQNRVFLPQAVLDRWLVDGTVDLRGTELTLAVPPLHEGGAASHPPRTYLLAEAVHVLREVTGESDPHDLVGRVKGRSALEERGAEILEGSMLIGEHAYDVALGWLGVPVAPLTHATDPAASAAPLAPPPPRASYVSESSWAMDDDAALEAPPYDPPPTDEDLFATYLLKAL